MKRQARLGSFLRTVSRVATVPTHVSGTARLQISFRKEESASRCERRNAVPKPARRPLRNSSSLEYVARAASCLEQSTQKEVTIDTANLTPKYFCCQHLNGSQHFTASRPNRPSAYTACPKNE